MEPGALSLGSTEALEFASVLLTPHLTLSPVPGLMSLDCEYISLHPYLFIQKRGWFWTLGHVSEHFPSTQPPESPWLWKDHHCLAEQRALTLSVGLTWQQTRKEATGPLLLTSSSASQSVPPTCVMYKRTPWLSGKGQPDTL